MTPEERFTKMEDLLYGMMEHHARHQEQLDRQSEQINRQSEQVNRLSEEIDKQNAGIRDLIVVSRTVLTTIEKLATSQDKVTEQIKELREAQAATDEKLNILIDTVDRIIRNLGKNGSKQ
jgi:chromosome segregation ATPase